jgi:release factor glutamine methyltransferase
MVKPNSIQEALVKASSLLEKSGIEHAAFEAEMLLRHLLRLDRVQFFLRLQDPFPQEYKSQLHEWLQRRMRREPVQYILGEQEFFGHPFVVNPSVLIPRPETELLVEKVLEETEKIWEHQAIHVVDVGTGSGAIAITLAMKRPKWSVTAIDISKNALDLARHNAAIHGVEGRINWLEGDFLSPILDNRIPFDLLISNPPYIPLPMMCTLDSQIKEFEPWLALNGGEDGLCAYKELIKQLKQLHEIDLAPRLICLEIGADQGTKVTSLIQNQFRKGKVSVFPDLAGQDRIVIAHINLFHRK